MARVLKDLSRQEKQMLRRLLERNHDVFSQVLLPAGAANLLPLKIDVQGHPPIRRKMKRVSPLENDVIGQELDKC